MRSYRKRLSIAICATLAVFHHTLRAYENQPYKLGRYHLAKVQTGLHHYKSMARTRKRQGCV